MQHFGVLAAVQPFAAAAAVPPGEAAEGSTSTMLSVLPFGPLPLIGTAAWPVLVPVFAHSAAGGGRGDKYGSHWDVAAVKLAPLQSAG